MAAGWCPGVVRSYRRGAYGAVTDEAQAILHSSFYILHSLAARVNLQYFRDRPPTSDQDVAQAIRPHPNFALLPTKAQTPTMLRTTFLALLIGLVTSASAQRVFRDQDPVPPDFGKAPGTLLVVRSTMKPLNKDLQEVFAEYYKGPFKVIDVEDLSKPEYADKEIYRYTFNTVIGFTPASGMGDNRIAAGNNYTYNVYDRQTEKTNGLDFVGAAYKGLMKDYAKKLEEVRASGK